DKNKGEGAPKEKNRNEEKGKNVREKNDRKENRKKSSAGRQHHAEKKIKYPSDLPEWRYARD
ncbi:MAG: hypothetical protein SVV80_05930, partial [Planctomycetota bacterium]|nr:hypothetical protein [Planctomycetota bacterium]